MAIVNAATTIVALVFLSLTMCLAERTGLGCSLGFAGFAGTKALTSTETLGGVTIAGGTFLVVKTVLAGALIRIAATCGIKVFAEFGSLPSSSCRLLCERFIFINGAVVEVLQSGQLSLYSTSRRPHFRQNGIFFYTPFRSMIVRNL